MKCYTIYEGYVVERVFSGNCATAEACKKRLLKSRPEAKVVCAPDTIESTTLYKACCELTPIADDAEGGDWFVSSNLLSAKATATLSVIGNEHNWRILQNEEIFEEWAANKVR